MNQPLKEFLVNLLPGPVSDIALLQRLLVEAWPGLCGANNGGMEACKILGRMEAPLWEPPCLTFTIERHGGTVQGSTRAELQNWCVNISTCTARITTTRHRQLRPAQQRMDVTGFAQEIADAILGDLENPSLKRYPDGRVKVLIGTIIPDDGFAQTIGGRRRRFRKALESYVSVHGWLPVAVNTYRRSRNP